MLTHIKFGGFEKEASSGQPEDATLHSDGKTANMTRDSLMAAVLI